MVIGRYYEAAIGAPGSAADASASGSASAWTIGETAGRPGEGHVEEPHARRRRG